ncbi:winged helix-turn-helix transcriptional regulator [Actinophytocola sp.]|uniref:winged helix-turn-helix transcriptional regulator n=1 Tax=Actinophytocola sp. TaxID=1872138 RepID=UPI00389A62E8
MEFLADCRTRLALDLLANTWNGVVVWALRHGPQRPVALRRRIGGISAKALNETLRRLEHNGLVARRAYREAPPRVDYRLTELGEALLGPLETLGAWAHSHGDAVVAARSAGRGEFAFGGLDGQGPVLGLDQGPRAEEAQHR